MSEVDDGLGIGVAVVLVGPVTMAPLVIANDDPGRSVVGCSVDDAL